MPSTAISTTTLDAGDHGEVIAGIPGLVGFPPTDSLVLVTFTATDRLWLGATVRVDLPDHHDDEPDAVDLVCTAAMNSGAVATALVVVGGGSADPPATLPHRDLVITIADVLADEQITLTHAAWVPVIEQGTRWWCYADDDCCGEVPDPRTSALAAAAVTAGVVTYASREDMAALFTPDPDDALSRRASLLDELLDTRDSPYGEHELATDRQLVRAAIDDAAATGSPELDDRQIVRLGMALANPTIRDDCLVMALGDRAAAAERLWTALIRGAPPPERAEPACLLAISAYLRGDGVLAGMAVEIAEQANPGTGLIEPLRAMLDRGLHPVVVRLLLVKSLRDAMAVCGE